MRDTKAVGDISEAMVLAEFLRIGKTVLMPFGDRCRYDLVLDEGTHFVRIQCKTGRLAAGTITFGTFSVVRDATTKKYVKKYYGRSEIDVYGVYCPETRKVYIVPVEHVAKNAGSLRVSPSAISRSRGGRKAAQYELMEGWVSQAETTALLKQGG